MLPYNPNKAKQKAPASPYPVQTAPAQQQPMAPITYGQQGKNPQSSPFAQKLAIQQGNQGTANARTAAIATANGLSPSTGGAALPLNDGMPVQNIGGATPTAKQGLSAPGAPQLGAPAVGANSYSATGNGTAKVYTPAEQAAIDAQHEWANTTYDPNNPNDVARSHEAWGESGLPPSAQGIGSGPAASGTGALGAPIPTPGSSNAYEGQGDSMWAQMMADQQKGLEGQLQQTHADEALAGRRSSEMNAMGGGGVGGAFAGGQAQVAIGGMQARQKAINDNTKQGLEMKMARLQQLIKQAEASKDRNLQRELQAEADKTQMAMAAAEAGSGDTGADQGGSNLGGIGTDIKDAWNNSDDMSTKNWYKPWKWSI